MLCCIRYVIALPLNCRLDIDGRYITWNDSFPDDNPRQSKFGFVFDIDGVLLRGKKRISGVPEILTNLTSNHIPYVIMTNGGGMTEEAKAQGLSTILEIPIDSAKVCLCHTPMKSLLARHRLDRMLLVGKRYEGLAAVARNYGFTNVTTAEDLHARFPLLYPDIQSEQSSSSSSGEIYSLEREDPIEAIMIMMDPIYWGRELQLIMDVLMAKGGKVGTYDDDSQQQQRAQIPVYTACSDFQYVGEFHLPRYGAGAFRVVLEVRPGCSHLFNIQPFIMMRLVGTVPQNHWT